MLAVLLPKLDLNKAGVNGVEAWVDGRLVCADVDAGTGECGLPNVNNGVGGLGVMLAALLPKSNLNEAGANRVEAQVDGRLVCADVDVGARKCSLPNLNNGVGLMVSVPGAAGTEKALDEGAANCGPTPDSEEVIGAAGLVKKEGIAKAEGVGIVVGAMKVVENTTDPLVAGAGAMGVMLAGLVVDAAGHCEVSKLIDTVLNGTTDGTGFVLAAEHMNAVEISGGGSVSVMMGAIKAFNSCSGAVALAKSSEVSRISAFFCFNISPGSCSPCVEDAQNLRGEVELLATTEREWPHTTSTKVPIAFGMLERHQIPWEGSFWQEVLLQADIDHMMWYYAIAYLVVLRWPVWQSCYEPWVHVDSSIEYYAEWWHDIAHSALSNATADLATHYPGQHGIHNNTQEDGSIFCIGDFWWWCHCIAMSVRALILP
ncbi:hypothetical protein EDB19DRAFT_1829826 [Suillus lakei]|nr:hypothetical protein EDB19DRAFT_1829826 [Suillus lakei]